MNNVAEQKKMLSRELESIREKIKKNYYNLLRAYNGTETSNKLLADFLTKLYDAQYYLDFLIDAVNNNFEPLPYVIEGNLRGCNHLPLLFASTECFSGRDAVELETKLSRIMKIKGSIDARTLSSVDDFKKNELLDDKTVEMYIYKIKVFIKYLRTIGNKYDDVVKNVENLFALAKFSAAAVHHFEPKDKDFTTDKLVYKSSARLFKSENNENVNIPPDYNLEALLANLDLDRVVDWLLFEGVGYMKIMVCFEYYMSKLATSNDFFNNTEKLYRFFQLLSKYLLFYVSNNIDVFISCFDGLALDSIDTSDVRIEKITNYQSEIMDFNSNNPLQSLLPSENPVSLSKPFLIPYVFFASRGLIVIKENYFFELIESIHERQTRKTSKPCVTTVRSDTGTTAALMKEGVSPVASDECTGASKRAIQFGEVIKLFSKPYKKRNVESNKNDIRMVLYENKIILTSLDSAVASASTLFLLAETLLSYSDVSITYNELCVAIDCCLSTQDEEDIKFYAAYSIELLKNLRKAVLPKVDYIVGVPRGTRKNNLAYKIKKKHDVKFRQRGN